jgi:hypothetical protein
MAHKYQKADEFIVFNEGDPVLTPITYYLPKPPPEKEIDGYGEDPKKQMWKPPQMPIRLLKLQKSSETLQDIYNKLKKNSKEYAPEIAWIKLQWERRLNGYWFFVNGKATYMDGWHYFYCGFWHLDSGLPQYRYRDYLFFHFARFCFLDTKLPDGTDLGRRLCYGFNYPKHRREGATYKAESILYEIVSRTFNVHGGIQSMDGPSAKKAYLEKCRDPWKKLPFFFKPNFTGTTAQVSGMNFDAPTVNIGGKGGVANVETGLQSKITFADSANRGWYDGDKLIFYHDDETGKTKEEDVYARHMVVKKALSQANGRIIHGLTIKTSTVGEMTNQGGKNFYNLCRASMYKERNANGETVTGLYNLFIPSYVCLDGFIDIFGNAIVDDPVQEDYWRIPMLTYDATGKVIGAKRYLENVKAAYLDEDSVDARKNFDEEVRLAPMSFDECFISSGSGSGLPIHKIMMQIKKLQFMTDEEIGVQQGNFRWRGKVKDGTVEFVKNKDGRFRTSLLLPADESNRKYSVSIWDTTKMVKTYKPKDGNRFTASADPYSFLKTNETRKSYGGGNVFFNRDTSIDDDDTPLEDWQTYRNVCTYLFRPHDPDDYAEDMLMMCVYYGAMMFPEINVPLIWSHFRKRGYLGYLKYGRKPDGKQNLTPGFYTRGPVQQDIFYAHEKYLSDHWFREKHIEILQQAKTIKGVDELTDFDLFVAVGGSYLGSKDVVMDRTNPDKKKTVSMNDFFSRKNIR